MPTQKSQETYDMFFDDEPNDSPPDIRSGERPERPEFERTEFTPVSGPRISPTLDPLRRRRLSNFVKWILVAGILSLVYYALAHLYHDYKIVQEQIASAYYKITPEQDAALQPFYITWVTVSTIFSTMIAMIIARLIAPGIFARWREAVEALRDWMVAGLVIGGIYNLAVNAIKAANYGPHDVGNFNEWLQYRCPAMTAAAVAGVLLAGLIAIYREPKRDAFVFIGRILLQVAFIDLIYFAFQNGLYWSVSNLPALGPMCLVTGCVFLVCSFGVLIWASQKDRAIDQLQHEGVRSKPGEVEMTVTVIGGKESGKTMFLLGAYYQWTQNALGKIRIEPNADTRTTLADDARLLYTWKYEKPKPTDIATQYTFNLFYEHDGASDQVAKFNYLDYPGGAVRGLAVSDAVRRFLDQVDRTDALILVVDMSYVRRQKKEQDWFFVRDAYYEAIDRILKRNGSTRVVPVCFVLTKCDEYADADGVMNREQIMKEFREFGYNELEKQWVDKSANLGPGYTVQSIWATSAIKYSRPVMINGEPDLTQSFELKPPPPAITPVRCAPPLLWLCAKTMRYNVTLAWDIKTMFWGSSAALRRQEDAIDELEEVSQRLSKS